MDTKTREERNLLMNTSPAAGDVAVEELVKSRHKRVDLYNIIVCQQLFTMPPKVSFWPPSNHEPLVVVICFPLISSKPWRLRQTKLPVALESQLHGMWQSKGNLEWDFLWKLWEFPGELENMLPGLVWNMLHSSPSRKDSHKCTPRSDQLQVEAKEE
eukprot:11979663-Ditylum_brightwellii.AAC.1